MAAQIIEKAWHIWCRALLYCWFGVLLAIWLACAFASVVAIPTLMFFGETGEPPETLLGKINLGMFCVSVSFLMLATFSGLLFRVLEDDLAPDSCMRNVVAFNLRRIVKASATAGFHIFAISGLVLFVHITILIMERVTHGP